MTMPRLFRMTKAAAAAAAALLGTSYASAAPILIDFTDTAWSGVSGQTEHSQTYETLEVTLSATGGAMTFAGDAPTFEGLSLDSDGIGIGDDEIGKAGDQLLSVSFSSEVTVLGYYLLDFFGNEGPGGEGEAALVSFSGGGSLVDVGSAEDGIGFYARNGLNMATDAMQFSAWYPNGYTGSFWFSDFALAGVMVDYGSSALRTVSVPEPATLTLLGFGLLVLGFGRGRRDRQRH